MMHIVYTICNYHHTQYISCTNIICMCTYVMQDPCFGCCAADLSGGLLWQRTPEGIGARVSCGVLHPTLNSGSHITRTCGTDGVWSDVSIQSCTFSSSTNSTLVVSVFNFVAAREQLKRVEEETKEVSFYACSFVCGLCACVRV